jgi:acetolactate synthase-1/2/3 large subunit
VINDLWRETIGQRNCRRHRRGQHQMWEAQYYKHEPAHADHLRRFGHHGLRIAGGDWREGGAAPQADVWVVAGDGGFQMTMAEMATIVQENLKVNIAIINNGYLGMVRQWQEFFYDRNYEATPLLSPNFVKLARLTESAASLHTAFGDVVPTIEMTRNHNGPVLIDFQVEQEDSRSIRWWPPERVTARNDPPAQPDSSRPRRDE